jgi:hypothetical protein
MQRGGARELGLGPAAVVAQHGKVSAEGLQEQCRLDELHGAASANHVPAVEDALRCRAETIFLSGPVSPDIARRHLFSLFTARVPGGVSLFQPSICWPQPFQSQLEVSQVYEKMKFNVKMILPEKSYDSSPGWCLCERLRVE